MAQTNAVKSTGRARAVLAAGTLIASMLIPTWTAKAQEESVRADFNGDGIGDLAIGLPHEDVEGAPDAGAVSVIYGSLSGLTAADNQFWTQNSVMGQFGLSDAGDFFGWALASGDFNGDGVSDLAIGIPLEDITVSSGPPFDPTFRTIHDAGAVNVLYGSQKVGLTPTGSQYFHQGTQLEDTVEAGDRFGSALAAGDFGLKRSAKDFDADDLAIGVPSEDFLQVGPNELLKDAGAVNVLYGSRSLFGVGGLSTASDQFWSQCFFLCPPPILTTLPDLAEGGDGVGSSLAAADFGLGPQDDLAIGVPFEGIGEGPLHAPAAGAVNVIYGSDALGLQVFEGAQVLPQNPVGDRDEGVEGGDLFGWSLAGGDLDGDGFAELAAGAPSEDLGAEANAGAIEVFEGGIRGLSFVPFQFWAQDDLGATVEAGDHFGWSLAIADFGGSPQSDLAAGAPFETLQELQDPIVAAGGVNVIYGSADGLTETGTQFWSQDVLGVLDDAERGDLFGFALSATDFGNGPNADLAIGVMQEDTPVGNAGAVNVLYGGGAGLSDLGNQLWHQDVPGIFDLGESDDQFGEVLVNGSEGRQAVIFD